VLRLKKQLSIRHTIGRKIILMATFRYVELKLDFL
jgi:hypothetical protein